MPGEIYVEVSVSRCFRARLKLVDFVNGGVFFLIINLYVSRVIREIVKIYLLKTVVIRIIKVRVFSGQDIINIDAVLFICLLVDLFIYLNEQTCPNWLSCC